MCKAQCDPEATQTGQVKVKTLEEIRREKAARIQSQQVPDAHNKSSFDTEDNAAKKPRLLSVKKLSSQSKTALFIFSSCILEQRMCA